MVAFRSRRLERLFDARLEDVTYAQITSVVTNSVTEDYDLDFKGELYGRSDSDKRALGGDVAAMANTAGGVILLGISEDDQARAVDTPGVSVSDAEISRIQMTVASQVSPLPTFDVRPIADPDRDGHGFILIAVLRSPAGPHAVLVNEGLRFPKRNGRTTIYLSEPQVAAAYRERFAGIQDRFDDVARYEAELVARLDTTTLTYIVVTLVPDLAGSFTVDTKTLRDFETNTIGRTPLGYPLGGSPSWQSASVGRRRLTASGGQRGKPATWLGCDLHDTGAGSIAIAVAERSDDAVTSRVSDEFTVGNVWAGLRYLARHARDRAAAGGNATVRVTICPVTAELPAVLIARRAWPGGDQLGLEQAISPPVATGVFGIDDIAEDGPPLLSATYILATGLFQTFGHPEAGQLTVDGAIRLPYWNQQTQAQIRTWAATVSVTVTADGVI